MTEIALVRHGETTTVDGVKILTPKGKRQILATTEMLAADHLIGKMVHRVFTSGEERTNQCAKIFCEFHSLPLGIVETVEGLHLRKAFLETYGDDDDAFSKDIITIQRMVASVAIAREMFKYTGIARKHLEKFLLETASDLSHHSQAYGAIGFTHSPYASLAVPDREAERIPCQIGFGDATIHTIKSGVVMHAEHIRCPYQGD